MSPTIQKKVRQFIRVVNYYLNMWAIISHKLGRLTNITSNKVKFKWTKIKQYAFEKLSRLWPAIIY